MTAPSVELTTPPEPQQIGAVETEYTYAGSSGYLEADANGTTAKVQAELLKMMSDAGYFGITVAQARKSLPHRHHGSLSSGLTNLHRAGRIFRLTEVRERCKVYVLPEFVQDRPCEESRPNNSPYMKGYREGYEQACKDWCATR